MQRPLHARLLTALVPMLFLIPVPTMTGCSSFDAPTLTVSSVVLADRSDEAVVLDVTLDAVNTNDVELPLEVVEYTVFVDGSVVFEGTRSAEATLRRAGTQQVVLPVAIRLAPDVPLRGEYPYRIRGQLTYVTPGEIAQLLFDAGVRRPKVSFSQRGTVDFGE
ncbi:MAG: LEA type 2 family protein [Planctomycetota bacterium]